MWRWSTGSTHEPLLPSPLNLVEGKSHHRLEPESGLPGYLRYCSNPPYCKFVLFPLPCILIKVVSFIFRFYKNTAEKCEASQMFKYLQVTIKLHPKLVFVNLLMVNGWFECNFLCVSQLSPVLESAFPDNSTSDYLLPLTDSFSPFSSTPTFPSGQGGVWKSFAALTFTFREGGHSRSSHVVP